MERRYVDREIIDAFQKPLVKEEKSEATIEKYIRDVTAFSSYLMKTGDWDLTLFTCTIGGATRVTVRCEKVE